MFKRRRHSTSGHTLVELVVAISASLFLLAGMGGSIYIAAQAFDERDSHAVSAVATGNAADDIMAEMQYATRFYERTPHAVTFSIPDRNGDGSEEKFRYAWSGVAGAPLTKQLNGGPASVLVEKVNSLNFTFLTRAIIAPPPVVLGLTFEGFTEASLPSKAKTLSVNVPPGAESGDLLIAAAAIEGDQQSSLIPSDPSWNLVVVDRRGGDVTLGVWWRLAGASEPSNYAFTWHDDKKAYIWMMRFTGHDSTNPINVWATEVSNSTAPPSPAVTTTVDNAFILRLGGIKDDNITVDQPGLAGHTAITMDGVDKVSGGAGYVEQPTMGTSGTSTFAVTAKSKCIAVTVALAPASP